MTRFRLVIATLVAVAMLSVGAVACTPEQQTEVGVGLGDLIGLIFAGFVWTSFGQMCTHPGCPDLG